MIADRIRECILEAVHKTGIVSDTIKTKYDVPLETPKVKDFGHYSTNLPFGLAKTEKKPPLQIAGLLAENISKEMFENIEAVKPGFINFKLKPEVLQSEIPEILGAGESYGKTEYGGGRRFQVEFVSANPTGPLSVGHGRLAAFGDALA